MNRRSPVGAALAALFLSFGLSTAARADQVSIVSSRDNTLYEDASGSLSNGAGVHFFAGKTNIPTIRRGLIFFDVGGNVPPGSTIDSVSLQLNMSKTISGNTPVTLHKVTSDWGEGSSNASANEGTGAAATTGDATWVYTFYNTATWTTVGGDFVTTPSASTTVGSSLGQYTWGSTPQMVHDVQAWLDAPNTNFGWLVQGDESTAATAKRFDTRENPVAANRPTLTITYTPPPPGSARGWLSY